MKPFTDPWGQSITGLPLQLLTMIGCSAGFFVFGYDQGIANAMTQNADFFIKFPRLKGDETVLGVVLALFVLGAMAGCLTTSAIGNRMGRRPSLLIATVLAIIGAAGMAGGDTLGVFCFFRLLNGYAIGILTSVVPSLVAEISKPHIRGLMMSLELVFAATGLMTSFWLTYGFADITGPAGWKLPVSIQGMVLLVTLVCLMFTPESPRYRAEKGRVEDAHRILERFHGTAFADAAIIEINEAIALEHAASKNVGYADCFSKNDQCFRYRTLLAVGVNMAQQLTGINMATYYSFSILTGSLGLTPHRATLTLGGLGIAGLAFCIFGCFVLMEKAGRVNTMLIGAAGCCIGQVMLAAGVAIGNKASGYVATFGLYLFLCIFSATHLPTAFVYSAEIVPLAIRSRATTLAVATQYLLNFVVVMLTPLAIKKITWGWFAIFAVINALLVPTIWYFAPEIAGLSLEGIDGLFLGGKVTMRRTVKVDVGGHIRAQELGKVEKGSFEHREDVDKIEL